MEVPGEAAPASASAPAAGATPSCQICSVDLSNARTFFRRYRICEEHAAAKEQMVEGIVQRFCQQCGRFHQLDAFDAGQRSCREELARHAARRRELRKRKKAGIHGGTDSYSATRSLWDALPAGLPAPLLPQPEGFPMPHTLSAPMLLPPPPPRRRSPGARDGSSVRFRSVTMTGRPGRAIPPAASPWAGAQQRNGSGLAQSPPDHQRQQQQQQQQQHSLPIQPSLPVQQQQSLPMQLLKQWSSGGAPPAVSSGIMSCSTVQRLPADMSGLAAAISALAGQASNPTSAMPLGLDPSIAAAAAAAAQTFQNALSDAASGSAEQAGQLVGAAATAPQVAELLQHLLQHSSSFLMPTVQSLPPFPEGSSLPPLPMAASMGSLPQPGAAAGDAGAAAAVAGVEAHGPVCQICRRSLADLLPFYKRYRVCADHMSAREVMREGVLQRFCQQCGRFHPLEDFDGTQRTCREELAWRRYRRSHAAKDSGRDSGSGDGRHHRHHQHKPRQLGGKSPQQEQEEQEEPVVGGYSSRPNTGSLPAVPAQLQPRSAGAAQGQQPAALLGQQLIQQEQQVQEQQQQQQQQQPGSSAPAEQQPGPPKKGAAAADEQAPLTQAKQEPKAGEAARLAPPQQQPVQSVQQPAATPKLSPRPAQRQEQVAVQRQQHAQAPAQQDVRVVRSTQQEVQLVSTAPAAAAVPGLHSVAQSLPPLPQRSLGSVFQPPLPPPASQDAPQDILAHLLAQMSQLSQVQQAMHAAAPPPAPPPPQSQLGALMAQLQHQAQAPSAFAAVLQQLGAQQQVVAAQEAQLLQHLSALASAQQQQSSLAALLAPTQQAPDAPLAAMMQLAQLPPHQLQALMSLLPLVQRQGGAPGGPRFPYPPPQ